MAAQSLPEMLERFEDAGQLVKIATEVTDPREIAEITRRVCGQGGPALVFGAVQSDGSPLVTNLLATEQRFCLAMGVSSIEALGGRLLGESAANGGNWFQKLAGGGSNAATDIFAPHAVKTAACQRVVRLGRDIDLTELSDLAIGTADPVQRLATAVVVSSDLQGSQRHVNRCHLQVRDRSSLTISWRPHQPIARDFESFAASSEKMPVAIVFGGPPAVMVAAEAALSDDTDGFAAAGLLADEPIEVVTCRATTLQVPAEAELVIEGHVAVDSHLPAEHLEPDSTGAGLSAGETMTVEVAAVTLRHAACIPAYVSLRPPNEQSQLRRFVQKMFLPAWRQSLPELIDFDSPTTGPPGDVAFVSVRKTYPGQPQKVVHALWGQTVTMSAKLLVIVDEHVNVHDQEDVWYHVARNVNPGRDVMFSRGPASWAPGTGRSTVTDDRMAIDATSKTTSVSADAQAELLNVSDEVRDKVSGRWSEYGLP